MPELVEPEDPAPLDTMIKILLSVIPIIGGPAAILWGDLATATRLRLQMTADEISDAVGVERLTHRFAESPEFSALVINVLETAARTGFEAKRRRLAQAAIDAALNDEQIDEGVLIDRALRELEPVHTRASDRLLAVQDASRGTSDERAADVDRASKRESPAVLATLIRNGLATAPTLISEHRVGVDNITEFGRALSEQLQAVETEWPPNSSRASTPPC